MHAEMKREIKDGLLRRILPAFAILGLALVIVRPSWQPLAVGLALAVVVGLILAFVLRRRVRAAGLSRETTGGAPVKVALEVRPLMLALWIGVSLGLGLLAGVGEERFAIELGEYGGAVLVPLILLGFGLSLRPKRAGDA